ncbi:MAG: DUF1206 domain-containing protein [Gemmatimonadaceae bacterium]
MTAHPAEQPSQPAAPDTDEVAEAVGPWICRLARVGYASKGVVYVVMGSLAALAVAGLGGQTTDGRGVVSMILQQPFGRIIVALSVVGLLGYAVWRFIAAWRDTEHRGKAFKGVALRLGQAGSGIIAVGLAIQAWRVVNGDIGESQTTREWTVRFLAAPAGRWLVATGGVMVIAYALFQFRKAFARDVNKHLHLYRIDDHWHGWISKMSRFGLAARGVVFLVIGWFIVIAAVKYSGRPVKGIDGALDTVGRLPYGRALLGVVAFGLVAYGCMQLVNARWRRVEVD